MNAENLKGYFIFIEDDPRFSTLVRVQLKNVLEGHSYFFVWQGIQPIVILNGAF